MESNKIIEYCILLYTYKNKTAILKLFIVYLFNIWSECYVNI